MRFETSIYHQGKLGKLLSQSNSEAAFAGNCCFFRNFSYVASLFMKYLIVRRLSEGQKFNQAKLYLECICQLIGLGSSAPRWVKDLWVNFSEIVPSQLIQSYRIDTAMAIVCSQEYQTNFVNHVVSNFAKLPNTFSYAFLIQATSGISTISRLQTTDSWPHMLTREQPHLKLLAKDEEHYNSSNKN
jgi:hypothetical protein